MFEGRAFLIGYFDRCAKIAIVCVIPNDGSATTATCR
jgi:hypothetical protein